MESDSINPGAMDATRSLRQSPDWRIIAEHLWSLPVALSVTETSTGRIITVNAGFERITGHRLAESVGRTTIELGLYEQAADRTALIQLLAGRNQFDQSEVRIRTRQGEIRTVLVSARRIHGGPVDRILTLFVDVSSRKHMEIALRESEERYRRIFSESSDAILVFDWIEPAGFGRTVEVNDMAPRLFGHSREHLLALTPAQWDAADNPVPLLDLATTLARERALTFERRVMSPNGQHLHLEIRCSLFQWHQRTFVLAQARDISERRRLEETLRLNEASLRVGLTAANVTLFRTDHDLRVTWAFNPLQGYSRTFDKEDRLGGPGIPREASRLGRPLRRALETGERVRAEINLMRTGAVRAHAIVAEPLRDSTGSIAGVTAAVLDIADQKNAEAQLRAAMQRFELLVESSPVGIFRADPSGLVTHSNAATLEITGYKRKDVGKIYLTAVVLPEDLPMVQERWRQLEHGQLDVNCEIRLIRPDGDVRWILAQARPIFVRGRLEQVVGAVTDITERRQISDMLNALVTARSTPGNFLANMLGQIARQLAVDFGFVVLTSDDATRFQVPVLWRDQAMTEPRERAITSCPCGELCSDTVRVIVSGLAEHTPETLAVWAPGAQSGVIAPLPGEQGRHLGHLCLFWRAPIRNERMVRQLIQLTLLPLAAEIARDHEASEKQHIENQLLQSQKFEALGALAGGIAHDFNNVLTAILNYATLAQSEQSASPEQRQAYLGEIVRAGHRAGELVRQILGFSRPRHPSAPDTRSPVNLGNVINDALSFLRPSIPSSIEIDVAVERSTPLVLANAIQMHQVVMNLCVNAAQAIGVNVGRLRIGLASCVVEIDASTPGLPPGSYAQLVVEDSGPGIASEILDHIFDPFFTTKGDSQGTGLGLALVRQIVRDHQGAVTVRSPAGQGAIFTVYLPATGESPIGESSAASAETPSGNGEHILLIDDEVQVLQSSAQLLTDLGYRVTPCDDPSQALATFWANPTSFAIVLTDFHMPRLTGVMLAQKLTTLRPDCPVILFTGYVGELPPQVARECGVSEILAKPVNFPQLAQTIARLLHTHPVAEVPLGRA